jgi:hypothetical protein
MQLISGLPNKNEKNCFLNCLMQSFCNLKKVRSYILTEDTPHVCVGMCLSCEIKVNFTQNILIGLIYSDNTINTTRIRNCLYQATNSSMYERQQRACVIETFETILNLYHKLEIEKIENLDCLDSCLLHKVFNFHTKLYGKCCNEFNQLTEQYFISISGELFLENLKVFKKQTQFDIILGSTIKSDPEYYRYNKCDCEETYLVKRYLVSSPKVLVISLLWTDPYLHSSHKLLDIVNNQINIVELFESESNLDNFLYSFKTMVCFSRFLKHYITVTSNENYSVWYLISDSLVKNFSSWTLLKMGLKFFKLTPVLLFYEQAL